MKNIINNKRLILLIMIAIFMVLLTININAAEDTKFAMKEENVDVNLKQSKTIYTVGGSSEEEIVWKSSNENVATVDDGKVTGVNIGTATITATSGTETATCTINVVYAGMNIVSNGSDNASAVGVNLILNVHDSEKLKLIAKDDNLEEVKNVEVTWKSSDSTVVSVTADGTIKAVKAGTATITASTDGGDVSCEVNVFNGPNITDFSNAKFETSLNVTTIESLEVSGITIDKNSNYYYIITSTNSKPEIIKGENGEVDKSAMEGTIELFKGGSEKKYLFIDNISEYAELSKDMYLWVIQDVKLEDYYYNEDGKSISHYSELVVSGKKIEKAELKLNSIIRVLNVGYDGTDIRFSFPTVEKNRKFNIKVGKITDAEILSKIQKNDYTGITELLAYAKKNNAIISKTLTTTDVAEYESDDLLLDGTTLSRDDYYFFYIEFDDENGKYAPVEAVTLSQLVMDSGKKTWFFVTVSDDNFKWNNIETTPEEEKPTEEKPTTPETKPEDTTTAPGTIPQTGETTIVIALSVIAIVTIGIIFYKKYKNLKGIK